MYTTHVKDMERDKYVIRKAVKEDCESILRLIQVNMCLIAWSPR